MEPMNEERAREIIAEKVPIGNCKPLLGRFEKYEDPTGTVYGDHPDKKFAEGYLLGIEHERAKIKKLEEEIDALKIEHYAAVQAARKEIELDYARRETIAVKKHLENNIELHDLKNEIKKLEAKLEEQKK